MTYVRDQSSAELKVHMRSLKIMPGWFDPLADRLWQEVEALQATIAQQAQMIEHLRGGPTPGYTAVDMTTAAAQGFRDGVASMLPVLEMARPYVGLEGTDAELAQLEEAIFAATSKEG